MVLMMPDESEMAGGGVSWWSVEAVAAIIGDRLLISRRSRETRGEALRKCEFWGMAARCLFPRWCRICTVEEDWSRSMGGLLSDLAVNVPNQLLERNLTQRLQPNCILSQRVWAALSLLHDFVHD